MRIRRFAVAMAALASAAMVLSACSSGGSSTTTTAGGGVPPLVMHANSGSTYQQTFNPYSPSVLAGSLGFVYEPLIAHSAMFDAPKPWLAESATFNDDGTVWTVKLRDGVTWNDGEKFDAEDVAFTFNQFVSQPATNLGALDVKSAKAVDPLTAEITFNTPQFAYEGTLGNTFIVPEHVWSKVDDPLTFADKEPVGTGPFQLDSFDPQLYTLKKYDGYWAADEIKVQQVQYPADSSETFIPNLQAGKIDWSGGFVANIEDIFVKQDPEHRSYWFPGSGFVSLTVNNLKAPFTDVNVRKALSLGTDRQQLADVAMQKYTDPASPTGLVLPAQESMLAPEYKDLEHTYDVDAANKLLDEAGYKMGPGDIRVAPDGTKMSFDLALPSSWPDFVTVGQMLEEQYKKIGIELVPQGVAFESWLETRNAGTFDVTLAAVAVGLTPWSQFRTMLGSQDRDDKGTVRTNFGRFYTPEADAAIAAYAATGDAAKQTAALNELQKIMVEQVPMITLYQAPNWFQFTTANWSGFPTEKDPYAFGAPFQTPDIGVVVRHLTPTK